MRSFRAVAASTAMLATLVAAPAPSAAEPVGPDGWICTTKAVPSVPASGPEHSKLRTLRPTVSFDDAGTMTMRFGAPVAAGAKLTRTGGAGDRSSTSSCAASGFIDHGTEENQRYRYRIDAPHRGRALLTVGNKLRPSEFGRVFVLVDEQWEQDHPQTLERSYFPSLNTAGWEVVKETVPRGESAASIRARLRNRVDEDPFTTTAVLVGALPVVHTGNDDGDGARPSDAYYADVDGTWTDTDVDTPAPSDPARRNVPGDGRFDQDAPPSASELAVGRIDFSSLDGIRRGDYPLSDDETSYFLARSDEAHAYEPSTARNEVYVIDAGAPESSASIQGWQAASSLGVSATVGSRADLDERNEDYGTYFSSRPTVLFQHGRGTPSSLSTWNAVTPGDIASPSTAPTARVVISAGEDIDLWDRADSLLRAQIASSNGAEASVSDGADLDGFALGDPIGTSMLAGIADPLGDRDPLATIQGDPVTVLHPAGFTELPQAEITNGCTDVKVTFALYGVSAAATVTADIYRIVAGRQPVRVGENVPTTWSADEEGFRGSFVDAGFAAKQDKSKVHYEVRPRALHTTGRGSYYVDGNRASSEPVTISCPWACDVPTAALPTSGTQHARSAELESTVRFTNQGASVRIELDRRHTGRTVWGARADTTDDESLPEACATGTAASAYVADGLAPGRIHEFDLRASKNGPAVRVLAGNDLPPRLDRGKIITVIETSLLLEIMRFPGGNREFSKWQSALANDGYAQTLLLVDRDESVSAVRARIKEIYDRDPSGYRSLVLLGHVPVPYSGTGMYDGHSEHGGAWSTDAVYADIDGAWTDTSVNITSPARAVNRNVPGDGKFDQNELPSRAELAVGRIDFFDLPALGKSRAELTVDYLRRNVLYRSGQLPFQAKAFTRSTISGFLANTSPVVGAANVRTDSDISVARADAAAHGPFLLGYLNSAGGYSSQGSTSTTNPVPALFMGSLGSYFGDWDSTNNFLRAQLALGLGALWENWSVDGMALGETVGDTARRNLDRKRTDLRNKLNSLQGDPTLRAYPIKPVPTLTAAVVDSAQACAATRLTWTASPEANIDGYIVERYEDAGRWAGQWRVAHDGFIPATATTYSDTTPRSGGAARYRVRPARMERTSRGSFMNLGLAATAALASCGPA